MNEAGSEASTAVAVARAVQAARCDAIHFADGALAMGFSARLQPVFGDAPVCRGDFGAALAQAGEVARAGSRSFVVVAASDLESVVDRLLATTHRDIAGGLVIAVADGLPGRACGVPADSRRIARVAHLPLLEPADSAEAAAMTRRAFALSEEFCCPVLLRLTPTTACGSAADEAAAEPRGTASSPRAGLSAKNLPNRADSESDPLLIARERELANFSNACDLNVLFRGSDRAVGFVTSGPAYRLVKTAFPDSPLLKMGLSHPLPMKHLRGLAEMCREVVVVEEGATIVAAELRAEGLRIHGHDILASERPLTPEALRAVVAGLLAPTNR